MNKLFFFIFFIFFLNSCIIKVAEIDSSRAPKNSKELIAKVISKNNYPNWLYLKGKINFIKENKDITLNINIKYRKDSIIWASVSAPFIGIELFRTMLSKDSVYYLNHTNKTFFVKPITHISDFLKADIAFNEIQEMITANHIFLKKEYKFYLNDNIFELNAKNSNYKVSADSYRILNACINNEENELSYEFSLFKNENNFLFPRKISITVRSSEKFEAIFNYSKIVFNEKQKLPFKIPVSYVNFE